MIELLGSLGVGGDIIAVATAVVTIASFIVKLTPSEKDDLVVNKIMKVLSLAKK